MIRTQISLSEEEYTLAKEAARRMGLSLAGLLRRSLRQLLPAGVTAPSKARKWLRYQGLVASGDPQSSQHIDDLIYGQKD